MKRCHTIEPFVQSRAHNKKKVTGFHTEGEGPWNFPPPATIPPPPPPRNPEIVYGYYISYLHVTEHKYVSSKCCLEILSQIASEAI